MKALSLWQPWASLIAVGAKRIETRSWDPPSHLIGQHIAIHASRTDTTVRTTEVRTMMANVLGLNPGRNLAQQLPRGVVLCTVRIRGVRWSTGMNMHSGKAWAFTREGALELPGQELWFGDFRAGRCLWLLDDVQPILNPPPAMGHQKLWDWQP
jgi:hypothetical protein